MIETGSRRSSALSKEVRGHVRRSGSPDLRLNTRTSKSFKAISGEYLDAILPAENEGRRPRHLIRLAPIVP